MLDTANAGSKVATRSTGHISVEERTMLWNASAFNGYAIEASDGRIHYITVDRGWWPGEAVLISLRAVR
jgi:hypothetical protein